MEGNIGAGKSQFLDRYLVHIQSILNILIERRKPLSKREMYDYEIITFYFVNISYVITHVTIFFMDVDPV